jgi:hypothetical protein
MAMKDIQITKRLVVVAAILIVTAGLVSSDLFSGPFSRERFNRTAWLTKEKTKDGNIRRGLMAQDVINSVIRPGMSADQVKELLGEPDHTQDSSNPEGKELHYILGAWDLDFVSTYNCLCVRVSKDQTIEGTYISDT